MSQILGKKRMVSMISVALGIIVSLFAAGNSQAAQISHEADQPYRALRRRRRHRRLGSLDRCRTPPGSSASR